MTDRNGIVVVSPDDPLSAIGDAVRRQRKRPVDRYDAVGPPVWPFGLGFDLLLAAGAVWVTVSRLRTPSRRIPRGVRIG